MPSFSTPSARAVIAKVRTPRTAETVSPLIKRPVFLNSLLNVSLAKVFFRKVIMGMDYIIHSNPSSR